MPADLVELFHYLVDSLYLPRILVIIIERHDKFFIYMYRKRMIILKYGFCKWLLALVMICGTFNHFQAVERHWLVNIFCCKTYLSDIYSTAQLVGGWKKRWNTSILMLMIFILNQTKVCIYMSIHNCTYFNAYLADRTDRHVD